MIDLASEAQELFEKYPKGKERSALLPLLRRAQDRDGYLTNEAMEEIARLLSISAAEVRGVASFYSMIHLKPVGRHVVSVCHNLACNLLGAERVIERLEEHLAISCGETTSDGEFTLERAECLAFCDKAPMIQIDYDEMIGPLTPSSALDTIERVRTARATEPAPLVDSIDLTDEEERLLHREEEPGGGDR